MAIRITDQSYDQHTQNPPPEGETGLTPDSDRTVFVAGTGTDDRAIVLRGAAATDLGFAVTSPAGEAASGPATTRTDATHGLDRLSMIGWNLRPSAGTYTVGSVEHPEERKLPPRWQLALLSHKTSTNDPHL